MTGLSSLRNIELSLETLGGLFDEGVQPGAVFFLPLFHRQDFAAESRKLGQFLLNFLQALMALAVRDLGLGAIGAAKPVLCIQRLDLGDFRPKKAYFVSKNFQMIHTI